MGDLIDARTRTGDEFEVTAEAIAAYAELTGDYNPIHLDPVFAAATPMKGVIAHGTMSLALIWRLLRRDFGPARSAAARLDIRFTRPVRIGARLRARHAQGEDGDYLVWVEDQAGETVIKGSARL